MNTIFKTQLKNANIKLKEHYNNDALIKLSILVFKVLSNSLYLLFILLILLKL